MNAELKKIDELNAELTITVGSADLAPRIEKQLKEYRRQAQVPGFRRGMVPMGQIQRMYGKQIKVEQLNEAVQDALVDYLKTSECKYVGEPLMNPEKSPKADDFDTAQEFTVVFDMGLQPQVEVKLSKKNKIARKAIKITDQDIDLAVRSMRDRYGKFEESQEAAEGDLLRADLRQLDADGNVLEGGIESLDALLRLPSIADAAVRQEFVGKAPGQDVVFNPKTALGNTSEIAALLRIDPNDAADLDCRFQATVKTITRHTPAELDAELFEKAFKGEGIATEEDFRARVRRDIEARNKMVEDSRFHDAVIDYMISKVEPQLPEEFLKRWLTTRHQDLTAERVEADWANYRRSFKWQLIMDQVAEEHQLKIDDADLLEKAKAEVRAAFSMYTMGAFPEETIESIAKSRLEKGEGVNHIASLAMEEKVVAKIAELVTVDVAEVTPEEFQRL